MQNQKSTNYQLTDTKMEAEPKKQETYETHEIKLSYLLDNYISGLPNSKDWAVLAIDPYSNIVVIKRTIKQNVEEKQNGA
jgi:hypothetical protein